MPWISTRNIQGFEEARPDHGSLVIDLVPIVEPTTGATVYTTPENAVLVGFTSAIASEAASIAVRVFKSPGFLLAGGSLCVFLIALVLSNPPRRKRRSQFR